MNSLVVKPSQINFFQLESGQPETIGSQLFKLSQAALQMVEDQQDKYEVVFAVFTKYISEAKLTYEPNASSLLQTFLLQPPNVSYKVNCFVLSKALIKLFKAYNLRDVKKFVYYADFRDCIKMKPPGLYNEMRMPLRCFDEKLNIKMTEQGYFLFACHAVVKRFDKTFFDPTFCCFYKKEGSLHEVVNINTIP